MKHEPAIAILVALNFEAMKFAIREYRPSKFESG
jgi:hypothetical protein